MSYLYQYELFQNSQQCNMTIYYNRIQRSCLEAILETFGEE